MAKIWEYVGNKSSCFLSIITLQVRYKDMENEVIVFKNGELELEVNVSDDRENVWLSKQQMVELFQRDRTVISKHLKNFFDEGELLENSNTHFLRWSFRFMLIYRFFFCLANVVNSGCCIFLQQPLKLFQITCAERTYVCICWMLLD